MLSSNNSGSAWTSDIVLRQSRHDRNARGVHNKCGNVWHIGVPPFEDLQFWYCELGIRTIAKRLSSPSVHGCHYVFLIPEMAWNIPADQTFLLGFGKNNVMTNGPLTWAFTSPGPFLTRQFWAEHSPTYIVMNVILANLLPVLTLLCQWLANEEENNNQQHIIKI